MVVTIHQPEHLPWLGFLDKARQADLFVLLDDVAYRKNYFLNRNRIRGSQGSLWLTVPVLTKHRFAQPIREVEINALGAPRWRERCWNAITMHYGKAPYFVDYRDVFERLYTTTWTQLADLNEAIIRCLFTAFRIDVRIVKSSELSATGKRGDLVLDICRRVGATTYLSGVSGRDYLDESAFTRAGMELRIQEFRHPIYAQRYAPFVPGMSAVDLLFNHGPASRSILADHSTPRLDLVFS